MKKTEILKQTYELTNDFNNDLMLTSLKSQIESKVFTELIRNEKHSLTLEFRVLVNEEEREDVDPRLADLVDCVEYFKRLLERHKEDGYDPIKESLGKGELDLFIAWKKAVETISDKY